MWFQFSLLLFPVYIGLSTWSIRVYFAVLSLFLSLFEFLSHCGLACFTVERSSDSKGENYKVLSQSNSYFENLATVESSLHV